MIEKAVEALQAHFPIPFQNFFGPDVGLVPVPRRTPLHQGALWPPLRICEEMAAVGLGQVAPYLARTVAITRSSTAGPGNRPDPEDHERTIACQSDLIGGSFPRLTIVDDVVTRGSTMVACYNILKAQFPQAEIRGFALVRTRGLVDDIDKILDPVIGTISYENGYLDRSNP